MFKTIVAKFAGTCRRCGNEIVPGSKIRYGGKGRTYHLKADCPEGATVAAIAGEPLHPDDEAEAAARGSATPRGVSHYTRFSSGAEVYVNKRGRCEDAPCCGCCS